MKKDRVQSAFTLLEIMVVVIVIGVLATVAITGYTSIMEKVRSNRAKMNVMAIHSAARMYYVKGNPNPGILNNLAEINTTLNLHIPPDDYFDYGLEGISDFTTNPESTVAWAERKTNAYVWETCNRPLNLSVTNPTGAGCAVSAALTDPNPLCIAEGRPCP